MGVGKRAQSTEGPGLVTVSELPVSPPERGRPLGKARASLEEEAAQPRRVSSGWRVTWESQSRHGGARCMFSVLTVPSRPEPRALGTRRTLAGDRRPVHTDAWRCAPSRQQARRPSTSGPALRHRCPPGSSQLSCP